MREYKLNKGQFAGKTVIFETDGETVIVVCKKCGWKDWQTFFIKGFTETDIYRQCPKCDSFLGFEEVSCSKEP